MAELIFVVKAASMGFAVSKPYGDCEPYDVIIEENGRVFRIQVKSVFTTQRWGYSSRRGSDAPAQTPFFDTRRMRSTSSPLTSLLTMPGTSSRWRRLGVSRTSASIPRARKGTMAGASRNTAKPGTCSVEERHVRPRRRDVMNYVSARIPMKKPGAPCLALFETWASRAQGAYRQRPFADFTP